jgi:hypothetical protein
MRRPTLAFALTLAALPHLVAGFTLIGCGSQAFVEALDAGELLDAGDGGKFGSEVGSEVDAGDGALDAPELLDAGDDALDAGDVDVGPAPIDCVLKNWDTCAQSPDHRWPIESCNHRWCCSTPVASCPDAG